MSEIFSSEYCELVLEDVDTVFRRNLFFREEAEKKFGDAIDEVHSFLTGREDLIDRLTIVRAVERLGNDGMISPYSVEDCYRIAEAYMNKYGLLNKKNEVSPEALIAMDS